MALMAPPEATPRSLQRPRRAPRIGAALLSALAVTATTCAVAGGAPTAVRGEAQLRQGAAFCGGVHCRLRGALDNQGQRSLAIGRHAESQEGKPKAFSKSRLRAESDSPFGSPIIVIAGFFAVSAFVSFVLQLPRLGGSLSGAPNSDPIESVLQNLALDAGGLVLFSFITDRVSKDVEAREQAREEGLLISRAPVDLRIGDEELTVRLKELRSARTLPAKRPVLCMGKVDFLRRCLEASTPLSEEIIKSDLLLVPVLTDGADTEVAALSEASKGMSYVALPKADDSWDELCDMQLNQARTQELDEEQGLVVVVKKNGRVGTRFLGVPNWRAITAEIAARENKGLDTTNI